MPKYNPRDYIDPVEQTHAAGGGTTSIAATRFGQEGPRMAPRVDTAGMEIANRQAGRTRDQQMEAVDLTRQAALGQAPSAAQIQQQQGIEQGMRQQLALANSARGGSGATLGALRSAQDQTAQMAAAGAQQGAALRAQEMAAARGMLGQQLSGIQGQDQALGAQALQLGMSDQQAALAQTGMDDSRALGMGGLALQGAGQADNLLLGQQGLELQGQTATADLAFEKYKSQQEARQAYLAMALGAATGGLMGGASIGKGK